MTDRGSNIRRTDEIISRFIALWPLWSMLAVGTVTAVNFYQKVNDLVADQKAMKARSDERRDRNREEFEEIRTRLTRLETILDHGE